MTAIGHLRCRNHPDREAAARCPGCRQTYCRECVAEHDGRILCSACLRKEAETAEGRKAWRLGTLGTFLLLSSLPALWLFFYLTGRILLAVPAPFHNGSFWIRQ